MPKSEAHKNKVVSISLPGQTQHQMPNGQSQSEQMPQGIAPEMSETMPQSISHGQMPPSSGNN